MSGSILAAWSLAAFAVVLALIGAWLIAINWPLPLSEAEWGFPGFQGLGALVLAGVGALVAQRRPANPIGWLLLAAGVMSAVQFVGHQYALYGLVVAPGSVPSPSVGSWIEEWIWLPLLACMGIFTFLLFPTGGLPSPRWRPVAWLAVAGVILGVAGTIFAPTQRVPNAVNPIAPDGPPAFADPLVGIGVALLTATLAAASTSLFIRFRRSSGLERQQLKWLALGAIVIGFAFLPYTLVTLATGDESGPWSAILALSLLSVPATIAIAMLRYGLYEVDRLINRTLVYGLVSVVLVSLYAASVLVLQPVLVSVTGGETLAVAGSTLLAATIFQPVRKLIQSSVDRRFYRSRCDTRRTLETFGARLRDQVDLNELRAELREIVAETMQPASIAVWLRGTNR